MRGGRSRRAKWWGNQTPPTRNHPHATTHTQPHNPPDHAAHVEQHGAPPRRLQRLQPLGELEAEGGVRAAHRQPRQHAGGEEGVRHRVQLGGPLGAGHLGVAGDPGGALTLQAGGHLGAALLAGAALHCELFRHVLLRSWVVGWLSLVLFGCVAFVVGSRVSSQTAPTKYSTLLCRGTSNRCTHRRRTTTTPAQNPGAGSPHLEPRHLGLGPPHRLLILVELSHRVPGLLLPPPAAPTGAAVAAVGAHVVAATRVAGGGLGWVDAGCGVG